MIELIVTKIPLHDRPSSAAYWRSRPPEERLADLESLRREYHLWKYGTEPRLQAACQRIGVNPIGWTAEAERSGGLAGMGFELDGALVAQGRM